MSQIEDQQRAFRDRLNRISPSFCAAKWMQVTLHLHSGYNHSCHHPKAHKTPLSELINNPSALHNTLFKKEQRQKMKDGARPSECGYCWGVEDLGPDMLSDRTFKSADFWAAPYLDRIRELPTMADINPSYVEVSFSNVCNFRCSYCSANFSSRWKDDLKKNGSYTTKSGEQTMNIYPEEDNPYIKAFWEWWPDLVKDLLVFRITGGEPLLSKNTFRVLEDLALNPRPELEVCINSNLGISDASFEKFLALVQDLTNNGKVKTFRIFTSIEAWDQKAEYIRNGLEVQKFKKNLESFLSQVPKAHVGIMATYNALSVTSYKDLLMYVRSLKAQFARGRIHFDTSYLRHPLYQTVQVLPETYQSYVEESLAYMKSHPDTNAGGGFNFIETMKLERTLEWMKAGLPESTLKQRRQEFHTFFSEHDQRRGTRFLDSFPEMEGFWNSCKELS